MCNDSHYVNAVLAHTERRKQMPEELTRENLMVASELDADEFDDLYERMLRLVRNYGTIGVGNMLKYLDQELVAGREEIE